MSDVRSTTMNGDVHLILSRAAANAVANVLSVPEAVIDTHTFELTSSVLTEIETQLGTWGYPAPSASKPPVVKEHGSSIDAVYEDVSDRIVQRRTTGLQPGQQLTMWFTAEGERRMKIRTFNGENT